MNIFKRIFGKSKGYLSLPDVSSGAPMPKCKPPKAEECCDALKCIHCGGIHNISTIKFYHVFGADKNEKCFTCPSCSAELVVMPSQKG